MLVAKQVADFITMIRAMLAFVFAWLGVTQGAEGLPIAAWLLITSWTSDALDGPIARRSRVQYSTWLGDHDLQVDMAVAAGLLVYMLEAGYLSLVAGALYALVWVLIFYRWDVLRSLGMLFQAPIYTWFIFLALKEAPLYGYLLISWILAVVIITWPRFPNQVVPEFLAGVRAIKLDGKHTNH